MPPHFDAHESFGCMTMPDFDAVSYVRPFELDSDSDVQKSALDLLALAAAAVGATPPLTAAASPSPPPSLRFLQLTEAAAGFSVPLLSQKNAAATPIKPLKQRKRKRTAAVFASEFRPSTPTSSSCSDDDDSKSVTSQRSSVSSVSSSPNSSKRAKHAASSTTNASQFKCEYCAAVFMRNQDLTRHVSSVHEKSVLFTCPGCPGTRFSRKDALKRHIRTFKCYTPESLNL